MPFFGPPCIPWLTAQKRQSEWWSLLSTQSRLAWYSLSTTRISAQNVLFPVGHWKTHHWWRWPWWLAEEMHRVCGSIPRRRQQWLSCGRNIRLNSRILVSRRAGVDVTPFGILKFIVSFGGNDVFPNLQVGLQILLTVSISVVQDEIHCDVCQDNNMTESRLTNTAVLSVERETVEQVNVTKFIENFTAEGEPKVLI